MDTRSTVDMTDVRRARACARTRGRALLETPELNALQCVDIAFSARGDLLVDSRHGPRGAEPLEARLWLGDVESGLLIFDGLLEQSAHPEDEERFHALHGRSPTLDRLSTDVVQWNSPGRASRAFLVTDWCVGRGPYGLQEQLVVSHLNKSHGSLFRQLAERMLLRRVADDSRTRVVSVDQEGLLVAVDDDLLHIPFHGPCTNASEADAALLRLAWSLNPNLLPPLLLRPKVSAG